MNSKYSGQRKDFFGISLFTGGGIGDLALRAAGVNVLIASELLEDRAQVYKENYPESLMIVGDLVKNKKLIIEESKKVLRGKDLDVLFATPPCQGMSKNGRGKLLNGIRSGLKAEFDVRNTLALHAVDIALELNPKLLIFENVPEMQYTLVEDDNGKAYDLLDLIRRKLEPYYIGVWQVVEFADYGVPQRRQRLITIFTRVTKLQNAMRFGGSLFPEKTHSQYPTLFTEPWVTVEKALKGIPPLDAVSKEDATHPTISYHRVPVLDNEKYLWVSNTAAGKSAFDNQCINPKCGFQGNLTHGSKHTTEGINKSNKQTPIRCLKCGDLLPRPWVIENGEHRIMSGFTSSYKRMQGNLPASALTRNLSYACSDQKLHPKENRVLSLYEAFILHTISEYSFQWKRADGKKISDKTIREIIGESIPPKGLELIFRFLLQYL